MSEPLVSSPSSPCCLFSRLAFACPSSPYDIDNNILRAIGDILLPDLLSVAFSASSSSSFPTSFTSTELGCGTGRNTAKLRSPIRLSQDVKIRKIRKINALLLSPKILDTARQRCKETSPTSTLSNSTPPPLQSLQASGFSAFNTHPRTPPQRNFLLCFKEFDEAQRRLSNADEHKR
ncbi:hypothetical protein PZA11_007424 [Diplocarpon coronariae]